MTDRIQRNRKPMSLMAVLKVGARRLPLMDRLRLWLEIRRVC